MGVSATQGPGPGTTTNVPLPGTAVMRAELVDEGYEAFFAAHTAEFERFLTGMLGSEADVRGGRAGVADALQEAMLGILREWGDLEQVGDDERARRLYRCLRDAAGEALRREHGRRGARRRRPRVLSYDFSALEVDGESLEPRERELTVAVLGAMVRDIAEDTTDAERRALVDRGVLLAGLRALSEREAVVLIAVDRLGWEQRELADRLDVEFARLRETLFTARKLFYGVVRHAVGIDLDDEERARLHAYLAGELTGRDRRLARRHISHCRACQALMREQRVFARDAHQILQPLPFAFGAHVLAKPTTVKASAAGAVSAGAGLFTQAGAAKALAATLALMGTGVGVNAWLSIHATHPARVRTIAAAPSATALITRLASDHPATASGSAHRKATQKSRDAKPKSRPHKQAHQHSPPATASRPPTDAPSSNAAASRPPATQTTAAPASRSSAGNEFSFEQP